MRAMVWKGTANFDQSRSLHPDDIATILNAPGIAKGPEGAPLADPEFLIRVPLEGFADGSLELRGVGPAGLALRPAFRIVAGRMFRAGRRELVAGVGAARKFGLTVGSEVRLRDGKWPVVGIFSCGADIIESHLVGDAVTVMTARRGTGFAEVIAQLVDAKAYPQFQAWLTENPSLAVSVERKTDYDLRMVGSDSGLFTRMTYLIGAIMALGALFGVVKIMYAAVRAAHPRDRHFAWHRLRRYTGRAVGPRGGDTPRCDWRNHWDGDRSRATRGHRKSKGADIRVDKSGGRGSTLRARSNSPATYGTSPSICRLAEPTRRSSPSASSITCDRRTRRELLLPRNGNWSSRDKGRNQPNDYSQYQRLCTFSCNHTLISD
jgi:hypothetical protein